MADPLSSVPLSSQPVAHHTHDEGRGSAVSWPSIIAGSIATLAVSGILLTLGAGFGLAPMNKTAGDITAIAAITLIVMQWVASGVGGYLTGRLRTKWVAVHTHEVFFRDTAHGFLTWAVATIFTVLAVTSTAASAFGHMHGVAMPGPMHGAAMGQPTEGGPNAYYVDRLYRANGDMSANAAPTATPAPDSVAVAGPAPTPGSSAPASQPVAAMTPPAPSAMPGMAAPRLSPELRAETSRILMRDIGQNGASDGDKNYLAQLVAQNTGLSPEAAAKRVNDVVGQEQADAAKAAKAASMTALFTGLSMLIGAFIACVASAFGGSQRDEWEESVRTGIYR